MLHLGFVWDLHTPGLLLPLFGPAAFAGRKLNEPANVMSKVLTAISLIFLIILIGSSSG
jgi:hypothetical protein